MGGLNSLFDSFTGRSQSRDLQSAHDTASRELSNGYNESAGIGRDYYQQAMGQLQPWQQSGQRANALYDNALGSNGAGAQKQFMDQYQQDPFRAGNEERATESLRRTWNARGMDTSGNALLASARASQERGSQDYNGYLDRLRGQAGQGAQFAQYGAGLTSQTGNALMGHRMGYGQQQAGNEISYGNAQAAARGIGWQNFTNLAGAAAKGVSGFGGK